MTALTLARKLGHTQLYTIVYGLHVAVITENFKPRLR